MIRFILSFWYISIIVTLVGAGGWIANIVKLIEHIHDPITMMEIVRVVGVPVAPLGAILGFC